MTPGYTTEAQGVEFALMTLRQDFPAADLDLRIRWLPGPSDTLGLAAFNTGVTEDAAPFRNPGGAVDLIFASFRFIVLRVRQYDDSLPAAGTITAILTDLLHAGGANSLNSTGMGAGSCIVISQTTPYAAAATTALQLVSSADAENLAVDLLIVGTAGP